MGAVRPAAAVAWLALATGGTVTGCELVAGIEDIALTGDAGAAHASDATIVRDASSGDSTGIPESAAVDVPVGAETQGVPDDAEAATADLDALSPSESGADGPTDAGRPDARDASPKDARAGDAAGATDATSAVDAEAGLLTELIDDMEAHNELIPKLGGRDGEWYL